MRKLLVFMVLLAWICLPARADEPYKVVFIPMGATHVFWKEMGRGATDAARKLNVQLTWRGPSQEDGADAQLRILQLYISQNFDGIIITPDSPSKMNKTLANATAKGMSVVVVDSPVENQASFPFVGTNNRDAGVAAALQAAKEAPAARKILLVRYAPDQVSTTERESGFMSKIRQLLPAAQIDDKLYAGATVFDARAKIRDYLDQNSDYDLIFTPNESTTEGMVAVLKDKGLAGKIRHVGFDFNHSIYQAMKSGYLSAVMIQDPYQMGFKSMEMLVAGLNKKPVSPRTETPAILLTPKNLNDPDIRAKIQPFLDLYKR